MHVLSVCQDQKLKKGGGVYIFCLSSPTSSFSWAVEVSAKFHSVAATNTMDKCNLSKEGYIWLILSGHTPPPKEVREESQAGTQSRNHERMQLDQSQYHG